jgi:co-chaperonin GroES (HSP10)
MTKVLLSKLRPIRNNIVVVDMEFGEQITATGLVLMSDDGKSEGVKSRWGRVYAVGPEQIDVKVGEWILLEHGRWSRGFTVLDDDGNDVCNVIGHDDLFEYNNFIEPLIKVTKATLISKFLNGNSNNMCYVYEFDGKDLV